MRKESIYILKESVRDDHGISSHDCISVKWLRFILNAENRTGSHLKCQFYASSWKITGKHITVVVYWWRLCTTLLIHEVLLFLQEEGEGHSSATAPKISKIQVTVNRKVHRRNTIVSHTSIQSWLSGNLLVSLHLLYCTLYGSNCFSHFHRLNATGGDWPNQLFCS